LGDVLEAISCVAKAGKPVAPVTEPAKTEGPLQEFIFLKTLAPTLTAAEFGARAASAYFLWPKELLEEQLNRLALASTVQHDLFEGNPEGWKAYVTQLRKKVKWFGTDLPKMKRDLMPEAEHNGAKRQALSSRNQLRSNRLRSGVYPTKNGGGHGRNQVQHPEQGYRGHLRPT
jgi:hypothetical protein